MIQRQAKFILKAQIIHGEIYDYSLVNYISPDVPVIIVCSIHGQFTQSPNSHVNKKTGCPKCGYIKRAENNIKKYGVENVAQYKDIKDQQRQTMLLRYGTEYPLQNKDIKEKHKITCLEKYGHENIAHGIAAAEKIKQTNLERFGGHPRKNKEVKEKQKITNLNRYGVENAMQNKDIKEKQKITCLVKYGDLFYNNREKQKQTNFERFGGHPSQYHILDILPLIENYDWLFDQYIIQNKSASQIADELGLIWYGTILSYLRTAEFEIRQKYRTSYKCIQWLTQIENCYKIFINTEYQFDESRKRADGYCEETNTIYEFHGDYWHGNPEIYDADIINEVTGTPMGELYQKTIDRENKIKELGYNLVVMWENDFE